MGKVVVTVKQGKLRGAVVKNVIGISYLYFKGIPYAVLPVGDLRFKDNTGLEFVRIFVPTSDEKSLEPFVPRNFEKLIEEGVDVPFIIGYTDREGSIFLSEIYGRSRQMLDETFKVKVPQMLIKNAPSKASDVSKELKNTYFGEDAITGEHLDDYIQCIGDIHCVSGIQEVADIQAKKQSPTYRYVLSYQASLNIARTVFQVNEKGAMHFEDVGHLFYAAKYPDHLPKEGTLDRLVSDRFVRMWTDFAKTGHPTPQIDDLITEEWKPRFYRVYILSCYIYLLKNLFMFWFHFSRN